MTELIWQGKYVAPRCGTRAGLMPGRGKRELKQGEAAGQERANDAGVVMQFIGFGLLLVQIRQDSADSGRFVDLRITRNLR